MQFTVADRERLATAFHEAAHGVMVVLAGGTVLELKLTEDPQVPGWCSYEGAPEAADRAITYSGPWAAARWWHGPLPSLQAIRASLADNVCDREELSVSADGLPREVESTLEVCWPAIKTVAKNLFVRGTLGHGDVEDALGLGGDDDALSRSMIASGHPPCSFEVYQPGQFKG
ncbi:MAG: M50 family metallopeptidase [Rhodococcus sp. (in: high G+C Gram-positive bacteria)]